MDGWISSGAPASLASLGPLLALRHESDDGGALWRGFHDEDDLAVAIARLAGGKGLRGLRASAFGRFGERLDLGALLARGELILELRNGGRLRHDSLWSFLHYYLGRSGRGYERRAGPVPGVRCARGGGGCMRRVSAMGDRQNAVEPERGASPPPRGKRSESNVVDSWDEYMRRAERGWKAQTRGSKAWDRPGRRSALDRRLHREEGLG